MPYLTQMPTQEQLEALYKHIPASQDQLEVMQKQMLAFLEQQQKAAAALGLVTSSATGGAPVGGASTVNPQSTEMFQFPLLFALGVPATAAPSPLTVSYMYACTCTCIYMYLHVYMLCYVMFLKYKECFSLSFLLCSQG